MGMRGVAVGSGLQPQSAWCPELRAGLIRVASGVGWEFALKSQTTNLGSKKKERWGCMEIQKGRPAASVCLVSGTAGRLNQDLSLIL